MSTRELVSPAHNCQNSDQCPPYGFQLQPVPRKNVGKRLQQSSNEKGSLLCLNETSILKGSPIASKLGSKFRERFSLGLLLDSASFKNSSDPICFNFNDNARPDSGLSPTVQAEAPPSEDIEDVSDFASRCGKESEGEWATCDSDEIILYEGVLNETPDDDCSTPKQRRYSEAYVPSTEVPILSALTSTSESEAKQLRRRSVFKDDDVDNDISMVKFAAQKYQTMVQQDACLDEVPGEIVGDDRCTSSNKDSSTLEERPMYSFPNHEGYMTSSTSRTASQSNQVHRHTVLHLVPMSPLTPKRAAEEHTPKPQNEVFELKPQREQKYTNHLEVSFDSDTEPLSATLRRLGAARTSAEIDGFDEEAERNRAREEVIWSVPDWVRRLTSEQKKRQKALEAGEQNREALERSSGLCWKHDVIMTEVPTSDKLPLFDLPDKHFESSADRSAVSLHSAVESTVRGGRGVGTAASAGRLSHRLANMIWRKDSLASQCDDRGVLFRDEKASSRPDTDHRCERGDGWGGIRAPSSWFPTMFPGPLSSPCSRAPSTPPPSKLSTTRKGLRNLQLRGSPTTLGGRMSSVSIQPSISSEIKSPTAKDAGRMECSETLRHINENDGWEDEKESDKESLGRGNKAQETHRLHDDDVRCTKKLRVRFPSLLPKPKREEATPYTSFTSSPPLQFKESLPGWIKRKSDKGDANQNVHSEQACLVTYTEKSAEGRPYNLFKRKIAKPALISEDGDLKQRRRRFFIWTLISCAAVAAITCVLLASMKAIHGRSPGPSKSKEMGVTAGEPSAVDTDFSTLVGLPSSSPTESKVPTTTSQSPIEEGARSPSLSKPQIDPTDAMQTDAVESAVAQSFANQDKYASGE